ncbi:MAG TPA: putative ABC exporter domain-containing protein [Thermoanaerobaculia bacterium]|nr:putative ABC exporter domain-containing protein [Thermoanaerobaculia bacterium]
MSGALFELLLRGLRGRLVRRLRLLRQPKYLVASLAGLAYMLFFVGRNFLIWGRGARRPGIEVAGLGDRAPLVLLGAALALALVTTLGWLLTSSRPALRLTEAEINLLLPAPLPRRKVLEFALWKQQVGVLFGALLFSLFRGFGAPGTRLPRLFATWALFALVGLHLKGVSLWKARLRELPPAAARWRIGLALLLAAAWWTAVGAGLRQLFVATRIDWQAGDLITNLDRLQVAAHAGFFGWLLAPFAWLCGPLLGVHRLRGALFAAALLAAHYEWVVRSRARFEDATVAQARRQLDRRTSRPAFARLSARSRQREPFHLAPTGSAETAVYWKNLLLRSRRPLAQTTGLLVGVCVVLGALGLAFGAALDAPDAFAEILVIVGVVILLLIPPLAGLFLRNDLRVDLLQIEILRPWPIVGWRLVAAELLAPATGALQMMLAGAGLVLAGAAAAWLAAGGAAPDFLQRIAAPIGGTWPGLLAVLASLLVVGLPIALLSIAIQNLAALFLPGWVGLGLERQRGAALTGQRILVLLGHVLSLALGLLPPLLAVGAALLLQRLLGLPWSPWELPLIALLAAALVLAEVGVLVRLGGALWDRLDPARELLETPE